MNPTMKKYMDVEAVHFMAFPETTHDEGAVVETIEKITTNDYFDAIEVTWIKDSENRRKATDLIHASNLKK